MAPHETYYIDGPLPDSEGPLPATTDWQQTKVVGTRQPRIDGYERLSGTAVFPSDVILPDMLFGAILRCPHPSAKVLKVDTRKAEAMPGVRAVLTPTSAGADIDWYYSRTVKAKLFDPLCRFEGEAVAAVAAETPHEAWDAVRAIAVEYEVLPCVSDERHALADGAVQVDPKGNRAGDVQKYSRGDVAKGLAEADNVVELNLRTEVELHTPMETHGCVARWDGGKLTLWDSTQGVYGTQARVAQTLGLALSHVRVIGHYMGGGFGSKLSADKLHIIAALLAKTTARPVKLFLTRDETFRCVGNRPPANMRLKAGARKDGTLTALDFAVSAASGGYPAGAAGGIDFQIRDLYTCPNVVSEATDILIHAGPARAFRAPGHPQGAWALEQTLDALAVALGMDPVELRLKNVPTASQNAAGNPPYTATGLADCLREGSKAFGWAEARKRPKGKGHLRRGVGMAAGMWAGGSGGPPSTAVLKLFADGSANLNIGASDLGTGTKTVMAMVVAEELGVPLERIQVENADTGTTQFATPSGGSKTVPTESPAVRDAALKVKAQLLELAAEELKVATGDLQLDGDSVVSKLDPKVRKKVAELTGLRRRGLLIGVGYRGPNPPGRAINPWAAQFCEVEVNTRTGEVKILRFLAAQASGRVMNRLTFDNQTIGGITFGVGLAMTEARVLDVGQTGKLLTHNWHDYKLPTALDVPAEITTVPIDKPDNEANSTGARGLGEPVTIPTAAAIANAIYDAIGVRVTTTPATPIAIMQLLAEQRGRR
jgi:CO/xanthine dehydrogenase Mo-binding subunit